MSRIYYERDKGYKMYDGRRTNCFIGPDKIFFEYHGINLIGLNKMEDEYIVSLV